VIELDHLPAPNQQMTRYWGFYSNVARGKRRAAARRLVAGLDPDEDNLGDAGISTVPGGIDDEPFRCRACLTWAALIKKVYEIDPRSAVRFSGHGSLIGAERQ